MDISNSELLKDGGSKKILVVEDDQAFREIICAVLESQGFEVRYAENGLVAKTVLTLNQGKFDLVISDIRMPELDGVSLLRFIKETAPKTKVVLMTGFAEVLESQDAHSLGADEFLAKPFQMKDFLKLAKKIFEANPQPAAAQEPVDDEYCFCKIHVEEFTSATRLVSDIYICLSGAKFVKVAREGDDIPVSRIQTYKEKKVDFFYVRTEDFHKYTGMTLRLARAATSTAVLNRDQKIKLLRHTSEMMLTQVFVEDLDTKNVEQASNVIKNTISVIGEEPDIFELLQLIQSHSDTLYSHSVAVAAYSCMTAHKLGWTSQQTQIKLAMGGLFHDLGKKEIPMAVLNKPRRLMTAADVSLYETHPTRGRDLLSTLPGFPSDVIQIVEQHHENEVQTGYPQRLASARIHPLAKVVHLADLFCDLLLRRESRDISASHDVFNEIVTYNLPEVDAHILRAMMEVFNFPIPEKLKKTPKAVS